MTRAQEVDAQLEALYAQVPEVGCKGLCTDACGPIDGGHREKVRMARAGVKLPPHTVALKIMYTTPGNYQCPALKDGQCSTYAARPMVCRIWAASEDLPCPYGCAPEDGRLLTSAESQALLDAARKAGTSEQPLTVEQVEARLADPRLARAYRNHIPKPVATQAVDPPIRKDA